MSLNGNALYLRSGSDARDLLRPLLTGLEKERLAVLHLGQDGRLLGSRIHDCGSATRLRLPIRALLADAITLGGRRMIVAHNHPSGSAEPSGNDIRVTRALARIVGAAEISLVDHLIFAAHECRSMRAMGLL